MTRHAPILTPVAVSPAKARLQATLFGNENNEKLRNIKFYVGSGKKISPDILADAVAQFIENRRNKANGTVVHSSYPYPREGYKGSVKDYFSKL
ncbi:hypothetical protein [Gluconobacter albidus]|uniref:Uncharacterized protein n=1 Tax=Gluconobacter albidus TaxID=318683 RepID=A0ABQ5WZB8_9PROT|nr:hypothetical protein [Gluconobacter albidus]GBQ90498.1 hypothetical protein AA3250_2065 [Gluconobacter albidus NBRC 3250]GLQ68910.1 hypothetical protein GCM10007866_13610 [Gluconobacter albidus]